MTILGQESYTTPLIVGGPHGGQRNTKQGTHAWPILSIPIKETGFPMIIPGSIPLTASIKIAHYHWEEVRDHFGHLYFFWRHESISHEEFAGLIAR